MRVAGVGFRETSSLSSLIEAVTIARGALVLDALATIESKAGAPVMRSLGETLGLPVLAVAVAGIRTPSRSPRVEARFGTGSVAEAAALAATGSGGRIIVPRVRSADGMAMAAIAENKDQAT